MVVVALGALFHPQHGWHGCVCTSSRAARSAGGRGGGGGGGDGDGGGGGGGVASLRKIASGMCEERVSLETMMSRAHSAAGVD